MQQLQGFNYFIVFQIDEQPPAYEITSSSNSNPSSNGNEEIAATAAVIEAPPPYCLVDPSKIRNMDHVPHYPDISPVEIIDLNTNSNNGNDQVKSNALYAKTYSIYFFPIFS